MSDVNNLPCVINVVEFPSTATPPAKLFSVRIQTLYDVTGLIVASSLSL